ncbi:hypothetical protein Tco_1372720, partial [Tanacetum coccineum]
TPKEIFAAESEKFKPPPRDGRGSSKFTPLNRTPKEIFAAESEKFKPPPRDGRGSSKFRSLTVHG